MIPDNIKKIIDEIIDKTLSEDGGTSTTSAGGEYTGKYFVGKADISTYTKDGFKKVKPGMPSDSKVFDYKQFPSEPKPKSIKLYKEEQLNEIAPLLAAGARAIMPLLSKVGPALGRMASTAGKAGAEVAGKTATGIGRGTADVAKSAAQSAAQNAGKVGLGVGAYQAITDVANGVMGGVGEVYRDAGQAAGAIAKAVGNAIDEKTIIELAGAAVKYAIPVGILLAVLYGGKKLIDRVMSEGLAGAAIGGALAGATGGPTLAPLGAFAGNAIGDVLGSPSQVKEATLLQGQYGHSGKLQNFDDVEQDVLQRLRELSGMIRS
jgi:hypothetical protein